MELFNTPFETALRVLLLLETGARTDFSINMIAALDFAALYGKSFYSGTFVKTKIDEFLNVSGSRHCSIEQQCREVALCWRDVPDG